VSVEYDRGQMGWGDSGSASVTVNNIWNAPGTRRDSSVEARLSPHHVNHVAPTSDSHRVSGRSADQLMGSRSGGVDRTRRVSSFSVADILGPRYGSSSHHRLQQQVADDVSDDAESTSTRSNEDLSSSVLSHDSSTDGPSTTGSDRDHCWAETERRLSTSRKLHST